MVQLCGHRALGARHSEGLFYLAQDLRLAHHHGIEAGGHAEEMVHRFAVAVLVQMRSQNRSINAKVIGKKSAQRHLLAFNGGNQLHAVAGGNDHALGYPGGRSQGARGLCQLIARDGNLLPQRDRRGFVIHANERQCHRNPNLCTRLKRFAAQTAIITTSTAPET